MRSVLEASVLNCASTSVPLSRRDGAFVSQDRCNAGRLPRGIAHHAGRRNVARRADDDGTVVHRGAGATYRGRFSEDGTELAGGWRPDVGSDERSQANDDLTMHRV